MSAEEAHIFPSDIPKVEALPRLVDPLGTPALRSLNFEFHLDGTHAMVLVSGHVDGSTAPRLNECLDLLIERGASRIDFDLRDVKFLDSHGAEFLVNAHRTLESSGGRFRILQPQQFVRRLLATSGSDMFLEVIP